MKRAFESGVIPKLLSSGLGEQSRRITPKNTYPTASFRAKSRNPVPLPFEHNLRCISSALYRDGRSSLPAYALLETTMVLLERGIPMVEAPTEQIAVTTNLLRLSSGIIPKLCI